MEILYIIWQVPKAIDITKSGTMQDYAAPAGIRGRPVRLDESG